MPMNHFYPEPAVCWRGTLALVVASLIGACGNEVGVPSAPDAGADAVEMERTTASRFTCMDRARAGLPSGVYTLSDDGSKSKAYCENDTFGGGWRLISARRSDHGTLFGEQSCLDPAISCSGRLPRTQMCEVGEGEIMLATSDGSHWLVLPGARLLTAFLTREREIATHNSCDFPHACERFAEPLPIIAHAGFEPASPIIESLWAMSGGLGFLPPHANGNYMAVFNMGPYNGIPGALYLTQDTLGDAVNGLPGALYHRCPME